MNILPAISIGNLQRPNQMALCMILGCTDKGLYPKLVNDNKAVSLDNVTEEELSDYLSRLD